MDADLRKVIGSRSPWFGYGSLALPKSAQWFSHSGVAAHDLISVHGVPASLTGELSEAARRFAGRLPTRAVESMVPRGAPLVPRGLSSRLEVQVEIDPRPSPQGDEKPRELGAALLMRDAVFAAGATGSAEASVGSTRYRLHVELTPSVVRTPTPGYLSEAYEGTLFVRVEGDSGASWEHSYRALGRLDRELDGVIFPTGLDLSVSPSASDASAELRGTLSNGDAAMRVELYVADRLVEAHDAERH